MNYVNIFVKKCQELSRNQRWVEYVDLKHRINQTFINNNDLKGLSDFYHQVLIASGIYEKYLKILSKIDYSNYETSLSNSFHQAVKNTEKDPSVKAIYFEYDDSQANFFLCQRYDLDLNSDWAAYWEINVEAPVLESNIDLFADDISNVQQALITSYLDAKICIVLAKIINSYKQLPIAMAEHDNPIIYFQDLELDKNLDSIFESLQPIEEIVDEDIRVFKTPLIVPISVIMVIVLYVGYAFYYLLSDQGSFLATLKEISFEVFLLCEFGMISIILYNKRQLQNFLLENRVIDNVSTLEKLKPIIRTNMYSALFVFVFLGLGTITAIMAFIHHGITIGIIVAVLSNLTFFILKWYAPIEEQAKQIKSSDKLLEGELDKIIHCWMQKLFPDF